MKVQEGKVGLSGAITGITAQTTNGQIDYKVNIPVEKGDMCEFHVGYVLVMREGKEVSRHEFHRPTGSSFVSAP